MCGPQISPSAATPPPPASLPSLFSILRPRSGPRQRTQRLGARATRHRPRRSRNLLGRAGRVTPGEPEPVAWSPGWSWASRAKPSPPSSVENRWGNTGSATHADPPKQREVDTSSAIIPTARSNRGRSNRWVPMVQLRRGGKMHVRQTSGGISPAEPALNRNLDEPAPRSVRSLCGPQPRSCQFSDAAGAGQIKLV